MSNCLRLAIAKRKAEAAKPPDTPCSDFTATVPYDADAAMDAYSKSEAPQPPAEEAETDKEALLRAKTLRLGESEPHPSTPTTALEVESQSPVDPLLFDSQPVVGDVLYDMLYPPVDSDSQFPDMMPHNAEPEGQDRQEDALENEIPETTPLPQACPQHSSHQEVAVEEATEAPGASESMPKPSLKEGPPEHPAAEAGATPSPTPEEKGAPPEKEAEAAERAATPCPTPQENAAPPEKEAEAAERAATPCPTPNENGTPPEKEAKAAERAATPCPTTGEKGVEVKKLMATPEGIKKEEEDDDDVKFVSATKPQPGDSSHKSEEILGSLEAMLQQGLSLQDSIVLLRADLEQQGLSPKIPLLSRISQFRQKNATAGLGEEEEREEKEGRLEKGNRKARGRKPAGKGRKSRKGKERERPWERAWERPWERWRRRPGSSCWLCFG